MGIYFFIIIINIINYQMFVARRLLKYRIATPRLPSVVQCSARNISLLVNSQGLDEDQKMI